MKLVPIASSADAQSLSQLPIVAVDLGFSTKSASCGVAWRDSHGGMDDKNQNFGAAIDSTAKIFKSQPEAVLILEAPLCGLFDHSGRPTSRGEMENATAGQKNSTRYWSQSPGSGMALAAVYFLRRLETRGDLRDTRVHLLEGFVSRADSRKHREVAAALRDAFTSTTKGSWHAVERRKDDELISVIQILDSTQEPIAPLILEPAPVLATLR